MKRSNSIQRCFFDPLALAAACIISLLFANASQQYINTAKRNFSDTKTQTVVCFQASEDPSPEDRPYIWKFEELIPFQTLQKNSCFLNVTFDIHRDYSCRLRGYIYGLSQPPAWLPSIPVAHRKLII